MQGRVPALIAIFSLIHCKMDKQVDTKPPVSWEKCVCADLKVVLGKDEVDGELRFRRRVLDWEKRLWLGHPLKQDMGECSICEVAGMEMECEILLAEIKLNWLPSHPLRISTR